ncbi:MAG: hypothetical protein JWN32_1968, partial [Solirubrobacterales bacterium]|nr:hypothetical protein [Solirubrobacterales bacterium]
MPEPQALPLVVSPGGGVPGGGELGGGEEDCGGGGIVLGGVEFVEVGVVVVSGGGVDVVVV